MSEQLFKIDGIKVLIEPDQLGLWNAYIHPSVSGDFFLLSEWIVRGAVSLEAAIDLARAIIPLLRMGYQILHCDPEGWIRALDIKPHIEAAREEQAELEASESWKAESPSRPPIPRGFGSRRLSDQEAETQEGIKRTAARSDTQHDWAAAQILNAYSDQKVLARLRR
jgi:hypothetical protein